MNFSEKYGLGITGKLVEAFLLSRLPVIFIIASLLAGAAALLATPREEEEPQIVVPVVDVMINFPGASSREVRNLVTINLERKLWEDCRGRIRVFYIQARFRCCHGSVSGWAGREKSILKTHSKIMSYVDQVPQGVTGWVVRPVSRSTMSPSSPLRCTAMSRQTMNLDESRMRSFTEYSGSRIRAKPTWSAAVSYKCG